MNRKVRLGILAFLRAGVRCDSGVDPAAKPGYEGSVGAGYLLRRRRVPHVLRESVQSCGQVMLKQRSRDGL